MEHYIWPSYERYRDARRLDRLRVLLSLSVFTKERRYFIIKLSFRILLVAREDFIVKKVSVTFVCPPFLEYCIF